MYCSESADWLSIYIFTNITDIINSSIRNDSFPEELKLAKVTPLFKKADPFDKVNYRPVSIVPHFLKVYVRVVSVPKVLFQFHDKLKNKIQNTILKANLSNILSNISV